MKMNRLLTRAPHLTAVVLLCLLSWTCAPNESATEGQTQTTEQVNQPAEQPTAATSPEATAAKSSAQQTPPEVGVRQPTAPQKAAQNPLTLAVANARAKAGEDVCVNVQVADFIKLLSMQYTVKWDPKMLQFKQVQGFQLPSLGREDFGLHRTAEGMLTFLWIDDNLRGITLDNGATIYQICFQAIGRAGQTAEVSFVDGPTPFEVVNLEEKLVGLEGVSGKVVIY